MVLIYGFVGWGHARFQIFPCHPVHATEVFAIHFCPFTLPNFLQVQKDKADPAQGSVFSDCKLLDYELEMGVFVGGPTPQLGRPIKVQEVDPSDYCGVTNISGVAICFADSFPVGVFSSW